MEYVNVEYASIECVNIVVLRYSTKLGRCNMETIILDNINEVVSNEEIFQKLKIDAEHEYASEALEFAEKAKRWQGQKLYMVLHILNTRTKIM